MKSLSTIERRLGAIAERRGPGTALLTFANGTTRSLKVRSRQGQLELCLDAFEKLASYPPRPRKETSQIPRNRNQKRRTTSPSSSWVPRYLARESRSSNSFTGWRK
jgi:hypothetical protein